MNSIGASILLILITAVLFSSRRWALLGMMSGALYLTHAQVISIFGFNIFAIRFLELAGFSRVLFKKELVNIKFITTDKIVLILYIYTTLVFLIRSKTDYANSIGTMIDILLSYFIFRALIVEIEDVIWLLKAFVFLLAPYVLLVAIEMLTHNNPFSVIGGLSFVERDGRLRCMGSFRHPSLLGTLGSALLPMYIALSISNNTRMSGLLGVVLCFGVIFLANSGGPVSAAAIGIVGWMLWFIREKMSLFRRSLSALIILLAIVMKAPIWYLPAKISAFTGGDGWHRSYLMDVAFRDIGNWWMFGMSMELTRDWFPYLVPITGAADITNQFISFGLQAGLIAMILFIYLLITIYRTISKVFTSIMSSPNSHPQDQYMVWALGCAVTVHIATWFGITYFDQTFLIWLMQLAAISSAFQKNYLHITNKGNKGVNVNSRINKMPYSFHRYRKKQ